MRAAGPPPGSRAAHRPVDGLGEDRVIGGGGDEGRIYATLAGHGGGGGGMGEEEEEEEDMVDAGPAVWLASVPSEEDARTRG